MSDPLKLFLVDDHPFVRLGLRTALEREPDFVVVGEAATFADALARIPALRPDLLLLDLNLPDGNGWTLLARLREAGALPHTLVLSVCDEELYALRLLRAGARGYLMKNEPTEHIAAALRDIHAGNLVASPAILAQLLRAQCRQEGAACLLVTHSERAAASADRCLRMDAEGLQPWSPSPH